MYLGSGAALGTLDLRYLCSGAALGNLVQGLAVTRQRPLVGWLPRDNTSLLTIILRLPDAPPAVVVAPLLHPKKEEAMHGTTSAQLPPTREGHHTAIAGAGSLKVSNKYFRVFQTTSGHLRNTSPLVIDLTRALCPRLIR